MGGPCKLSMRELNLALSEFVRIRLQNTVYHIKQNPSWDLLQEGDDIYDEVLHSSRFEGMLREEEVIPLCIRRGLLDGDFKARETSVRKTIENTQIRLYLERNNPPSLKKNRERLKSLRSSLSIAYGIIAETSQHTRESYASKCRDLFVLENTLFGEDLAPTSADNLEGVLSLYNQKIHSLGNPRKLARSEEWRIMWGIKKGAIFRFLPLSDIQLQLSYFSGFYDGVFKHPDCPPKEIIEDDDMLDGWLLYTSKSDGDKQKVSPKVAKHSEVFVLAKDREEAEEIWNSNDPTALNKMQKRQSQVNKGGAIQHTKLQDFKEDIMRKANA